MILVFEFEPFGVELDRLRDELELDRLRVPEELERLLDFLAPSDNSTTTMAMKRTIRIVLIRIVFTLASLTRCCIYV